MMTKISYLPTHKQSINTQASSRMSNITTSNLHLVYAEEHRAQTNSWTVLLLHPSPTTTTPIIMWQFWKMTRLLTRISTSARTYGTYIQTYRQFFCSRWKSRKWMNTETETEPEVRQEVDRNLCHINYDRLLAWLFSVGWGGWGALETLLCSIMGQAFLIIIGACILCSQNNATSRHCLFPGIEVEWLYFGVFK